MIEYIEGDIFQSPAQVIVNTVNTVGVMGKGLALSFKQRYPDMFDKYKAACEKHLLSVGKLMLFYEEDHWLLMFPTKENWRNPSKIDYIEKGLMKFVSTYADKNISSVAFPKLGCGNGDLDWNEVRPLMEKYLKKLPIDVYIYQGPNPDETSEQRKVLHAAERPCENAADLSFDGITDDLKNMTAMLPVDFYFESANYAAAMRNQLEINCCSGEVLTYSEEEFFSIWDDIRSSSVFTTHGEPHKKKVLFALLEQVGYLSKIGLLDQKTQKMTDGYQLNAALGRVMSLKEA